MVLILYAAAENGNSNTVQACIDAISSTEKLVVCRTVADLQRHILSPSYEVLATILFIADQEDLAAVMTLRDVLCDLRIILILPDTGKCPLTGFHALRPRFVTYIGEDMSEVGAVLKKMKSKTEAFDALRRGKGSRHEQHRGRRLWPQL